MELDGSAWADPISAAAHDGRRTPQVQHRGSGIPIKPQQQRRVEMIRMRMRDEDVAHISERHSCTGSGGGYRRARVQEDESVHQGGRGHPNTAT